MLARCRFTRSILPVFLCFLAAPVSAQIGRLWSFDDLQAKADLVVIVQHLQTDRTPSAIHPDFQPPLPATELRSTLKVLAIFKPDAVRDVLVGKIIALTHYRVDREKWQRDNTQPGQPPPALVNTGIPLYFDDAKRYLVFLRHSGGGYEPLSGHTFPTHSVFALENRRPIF
jgi:hypothetical protein